MKSTTAVVHIILLRVICATFGELQVVHKSRCRWLWWNHPV